jgi:hypothetical protein
MKKKYKISKLEMIIEFRSKNSLLELLINKTKKELVSNKKDPIALAHNNSEIFNQFGMFCS